MLEKRYRKINKGENIRYKKQEKEIPLEREGKRFILIKDSD